LADGLLDETTPLLDYGCGRGDDVRILAALGISGAGWDPVHRPNGALRSSQVVNLGYVVNVIENPVERSETLRRAWSFAERVLVVSARLAAEASALSDAEAFADGYLTQRGTFQKLVEQQELKHWIDQTLETAAVPAGPGVFYAFRDEAARITLLPSRHRRDIVIPRLTRPVDLFERHKLVPSPLMNFVAKHGRVPANDEMPELSAVTTAFGSLKRAFRVIETATGVESWAAIARSRALDLLIYLALARFDGRPALSRLPDPLQRDIKGLFPSYADACKQADSLLFSVGKMDVVNAACATSSVGKLTPEALYVHVNALDRLSPVLRVFEGCAQAYIGRVEGANLIKLNRIEPKISYLQYPKFDVDAHPTLANSMSVHLQTFRVRVRDFRGYANPPILHRKETFVAEDYPLRPKFARITSAEVAKGLLDDGRRIGTRDGWERVLLEKGLSLRGHRLIMRR
jgi:DNA phosphorothioation-associated putative methyltransferase